MPKVPTAAPNYAHLATQRAEPYSFSTPSLAKVATTTTATDSLAAPREMYHERPSTAWSTEDDKLLMQYRQQGLNWGPIAEHFTSKTPNACRKRHERLMERKNTSEWDTIKTEDLAAAYFECREQMWKVLAEYLGENKWQTLETKCMEKGFKNLQTAARGARRGSTKYGSPLSHPSDQGAGDGFDDSGLGHDLNSSRQHTPPQHVLPPLHRESPASRSSPANQATQSSQQQTASVYGFNAQQYAVSAAQYSHAATAIDARPPVLSSSTPSYNYPPYSTNASTYAMSYPNTTTAATTNGWSMPTTAVTTSAGQRLPSLSQELHFLPPPGQFGAARNNIATSTYG